MESYNTHLINLKERNKIKNCKVDAFMGLKFSSSVRVKFRRFLQVLLTILVEIQTN